MARQLTWDFDLFLRSLFEQGVKQISIRMIDGVRDGGYRRAYNVRGLPLRFIADVLNLVVWDGPAIPKQ